MHRVLKGRDAPFTVGPDNRERLELAQLARLVLVGVAAGRDDSGFGAVKANAENFRREPRALEEAVEQRLMRAADVVGSRVQSAKVSDVAGVLSEERAVGRTVAAVPGVGELIEEGVDRRRVAGPGQRDGSFAYGLIVAIPRMATASTFLHFRPL